MREDEIDKFGDEEDLFLQVGDNVYPYLVKTSTFPDDRIDPPPDKNNGEPHFSAVDNPGIWIIFSSRYIFESGRYKPHRLPPLFVTVINNNNG